MTFLKIEPQKELTLNEIFIENLMNDQTNIGFLPKIDISEDEKNYYLECELPGLRKEDISLSVEDNILILKGDKKKIKHSQDRKLNYHERSFGSFRRTFSFSENINHDRITAEFENGVLNVTVPKTLREIPKEFQIKIN